MQTFTEEAMREKILLCSRSFLPEEARKDRVVRVLRCLLILEQLADGWSIRKRKFLVAETRLEGKIEDIDEQRGRKEA